MFTNNAFIATGAAAAIFGAYFGILLDSIYLQGTSATVNNTPFWKGVLRIIISLFVVAPFFVPYMLISSQAQMMIVYLFKQTVPIFFVMLFLFAVAKVFHKKLRLVNLG
jgi:hypothetical protein